MLHGYYHDELAIPGSIHLLKVVAFHLEARESGLDITVSQGLDFFVFSCIQLLPEIPDHFNSNCRCSQFSCTGCDFDREEGENSRSDFCSILCYRLHLSKHRGFFLSYLLEVFCLHLTQREIVLEVGFCSIYL